VIDRTQILVEDAELAEQLRGDRLAMATRDCVARVIHLPLGDWTPSFESSATAHAVGLLVLDGLIVREVGVAGRFGAELLGDGDLLRPWQREDSGTTVPRTGRWRVLNPCRVAVLDGDFAVRVCRYPELISALVARAIRRSRHLAVSMAIVHQPRVDIRLHMLFWDLADRWGTVRRDGVHVRLRLTQPVLADLVAAQRQTVSKALGELADRGLVAAVRDGWLLSGQPPAELSAVGSVSLSAAAGDGEGPPADLRDSDT
jgi:CRP/FNR family cyclic AMP-dependent transcriptional regulator